ncbi:MAG TPA: hypothetical protein VE074_00725, partial [Jatrophihabitantaceae bacterium]|nr:hypothetical protein [Jatrophihabitantaceae bacterium]
MASLVAAGFALVLNGSPASAAASAPGSFTSLKPDRLLDTRNGTGAAQHPVAAGASVILQVAGRGGVPASGAGAVVLNVTVTGATAAGGYLTVWPDGTQPTVSNLNFVRGQTVANLVISRVSAAGTVSIANNSSGTVQIIADVSGYYAVGNPTAPGMLAPLNPFRVLNTRNGLGAPKAAVGPGKTLRVQVDGVAGSGVPATGVAAVVLNVTVTAPTAGGYVTAWGDGARPGSSNLNFGRGQTVPNLAVVPVDSAGKVSFYNGSAGTVQLVADVSGYFLAGGPLVNGGLGSVPPSRLLDTRNGTGGPGGAIPGKGIRSLAVRGKAWVLPGGVSAVVLHVTATAPAAAGYITVWDGGMPLPPASNLNFLRGQTIANLVVAPVSASGTVSFFNGSAGAVQVIADVAGFVLSADRTPAPPTASTGRYVRNISNGGAADVTTMRAEGCADAQAATG